MPARTAKKAPKQLDREIELARQRKEFVSAAATAASRVFTGQPSLSDALLKRAESDAFSAVLIHGGPVFGAGSPERTQKLIMMAREGVRLARSQWATRSHATVSGPRQKSAATKILRRPANPVTRERGFKVISYPLKPFARSGKAVQAADLDNRDESQVFPTLAEAKRAVPEIEADVKYLGREALIVELY